MSCNSHDTAVDSQRQTRRAWRVPEPTLGPPVDLPPPSPPHSVSWMLYQMLRRASIIRGSGDSRCIRMERSQLNRFRMRVDAGGDGVEKLAWRNSAQTWISKAAVDASALTLRLNQRAAELTKVRFTGTRSWPCMPCLPMSTSHMGTSQHGHEPTWVPTWVLMLSALQLEHTLQITDFLPSSRRALHDCTATTACADPSGSDRGRRHPSGQVPAWRALLPALRQPPT